MRNQSGNAKPWLFPVLALLAVVIGISLAFYYAQARRARLQIKVPTPVLPNPNAFDTFCQAGDALVDKEEIAEAWKSQNSLYLMQRTVGKNSRAIAILRQGLNYPFLQPPVRSYDTKFPYYAKWRSLARLLGEDSQVRAVNGDWGGAAQSAVDAINLGVDAPHGAPVIGTLVGLALQKIGQTKLWPLVDHLSAYQAQIATKRMEFLCTHEVSTADALQQELWTNYTLLQNEFINSNKPFFPEATGDISISPSSKKVRQQMVDVYTDTMLRAIDNARLPYTQQKRFPVPVGPMATVAMGLIPPSVMLIFKVPANHTGNLLLMTALALRAYQCEQGSYPPSLQGLAPKYLTTIPDDPFAVGGTFKYRLQGTSYLLYSVGPDGKDDAGSPLVKANGRKAFDADSTGDIVAGTSPL